MTRSTTVDAITEQQQLPPTPAGPGNPDAGFGAEFRELARQRRFVRESSAPPSPQARHATTHAERVAPRMTDDATAMIAELARMSDRLVESREAMVREQARAEAAETRSKSSDDRLMAAQALVHDAQRATRVAAERCAWLEGRNETLQEALDLAVNAGILTRWRWRRRMAAN